MTVETHALDAVFHGTIADVNPGSRIARAGGATREKAGRKAIEKATRYTGETRKERSQQLPMCYLCSRLLM
jgi:hypothetical protein